MTTRVAKALMTLIMTTVSFGPLIAQSSDFLAWQESNQRAATPARQSYSSATGRYGYQFHTQASAIGRDGELNRKARHRPGRPKPASTPSRGLIPCFASQVESALESRRACFGVGCRKAAGACR